MKKLSPHTKGMYILQYSYPEKAEFRHSAKTQAVNLLCVKLKNHEFKGNPIKLFLIGFCDRFEKND